MLKELFESVWTWAEKRSDAAKVRVLSDLSPNARTRRVEHQGEIKEFEIDPPARRHEVFTMDGIKQAAEKWGGTGGVIWVSEKSVVLVTDDEERLDTVAWNLQHSATWLELVKLSAYPKLDQSTLIGYLKREFRKLNGATELLSSVRNIKWRNQEAGNSVIEQGKESLGNSIEAEVAGVGELPELLTIPVNVFDAQGLDKIVRVVSLDLDVRPSDKAFNLRPMKDELAAAKETTLAEIAETIRQSVKIPVFLGDAHI